VSNRYLDLEPVVAGIANELGLSARIRAYGPSPQEQADYSYNPSIWIALTANEADMIGFTEATGHSEEWTPLRARGEVPGWTDGFASILPVLKPFWNGD
jgi:hypothetical protein